MQKPLIATISIAALIASTAADKCFQSRAQGREPEKSAQSEGSASLGKKTFVARCASCHGEDGTKSLSDGSFLIERLAPKNDLEAALSGRLRKLPDEERRAVLQYVRDLVDRFRFSNSAPKTNK